MYTNINAIIHSDKLVLVFSNLARIVHDKALPRLDGQTHGQMDGLYIFLCHSKRIVIKSRIGFALLAARSRKILNTVSLGT